ncbi:MAG: hypothetical protein N2D54_03315 [Chloroflexota bacterium]
MAHSITIQDQSLKGSNAKSIQLHFPKEQFTVFELIRTRIKQEVADYNHFAPTIFNGLVQPKDAELTLQGYKLRDNRKIKEEEQARMAVQGFRQKAFSIFVNQSSVQSLDEIITLHEDTEIEFVRLVPLMGG